MSPFEQILVSLIVKARVVNAFISLRVIVNEVKGHCFVYFNGQLGSGIYSLWLKHSMQYCNSFLFLNQAVPIPIWTISVSYHKTLKSI